MKVLVTLNGTTTNPYHQYGLERNPFPVHAEQELARMDRALSILEAEPMPTKEDLIRVLDSLEPMLEPMASDFRELCLSQYKPGCRSSFVIEFPV